MSYVSSMVCRVSESRARMMSPRWLGCEVCAPASGVANRGLKVAA